MASSAEKVIEFATTDSAATRGGDEEIASSSQPPAAPPSPVTGALAVRHSFAALSSDILCVALSPDGALVAAGCASGEIRVFSTSAPDYALTAVLRPEAGSADIEPVTCVRFEPTPSGARASNMLLATYGSGILRRWHASSGQILHAQKMSSKGEALACLDVSADGARLALAGADNVVRVLDAVNHKIIAELGPGRLSRGTGAVQTAPLGHTNRVFAVKFHPSDSNTLLSGGWDKTVQVWNLARAQPASHLSGPFLGGDALDVDPVSGAVLTGSYRGGVDSLELWDARGGNRIRSLFASCGGSDGQGQDSEEEGQGENAACWVYCAKFVSGSDLVGVGDGGVASRIAVCGSKPNVLRLLNAKSGKIQGSFTADSGGLYSLDATEDGKLLAVAGAGRVLTLLNIVQPVSTAAATATES